MTALVAVNVVVLVFLGLIAFEYARPSGLGDTFYSIEHDFQLVKSTMTTARRLCASTRLIASRSTPPSRRCPSCSASRARTLRPTCTRCAAARALRPDPRQLCIFTHFGSSNKCLFWNGTLQNSTGGEY